VLSRSSIAAPVALADLPSPAALGATAPQLAPGTAGPWLSWVEPAGPTAKALRVAQWKNGAWTPAATVVSADDLMVNWADVPGVVELADGTLLAHWLREQGLGYGAELRRSRDGSATWQALGSLSSDTGPSEHGFVSHLALAGASQSVWLDGRSGATALYAATVADRASAEKVLDDRVCDCCTTASAITADGAVVVYRDRSPAEVRDIAIARFANGAWQKPALVHADGWKINGCPVNGPAVAALGKTVVVAWFTAADDRPRVLAARSTDGGATFGAPVTVDDARPFGRVSVLLGASGDAVVGWVARAGAAAALRVRRIDAAGKAGEPATVAALGGSHSAGIPRLLAFGDRILLTWIDSSSGARSSTLRVVAMDPAGLAAP
jgi:hypothetical protein